jgi:aerobic C4-dicarboxylate transport protein
MASATPAAGKRPFYQSLYFQVITAIVIGILLGHFNPSVGESMKPLAMGSSSSSR